MKRLLLMLFLLVACQKDYYLEDLQVAESRIESLFTTTSNLQGEIDALTSTNKELNDAIQELRGIISELEEDIVTLEKEGLLKDDQIAALQQELADTLELLAVANLQIEEYQAEIADLLEEISEAQNRIDELDHQLSQSNAQNASLEAERTELQAMLDSYISQVSQLTSNIASLGNSISQYQSSLEDVRQQLADAIAAAADPKLAQDVIDSLREAGVTRPSHLLVGLQMHEAGIELVDITPEAIAAVISEAGHDPSTYKNNSVETTLTDVIAPNDFVLRSTYLGINSSNFSTFTQAADNLGVSLPNVESDYDIYIIEYFGDTGNTGKWGGDGSQYDSYRVDDDSAEHLMVISEKYGTLKVKFYDQDGNVISYNGQTEFVPNDQGEFIGPRQFAGNEFDPIALPSDLSHGGSGEWILGQVEYELYLGDDTHTLRRVGVRRAGGTSGSGTRRVGVRRAQ